MAFFLSFFFKPFHEYVLHNDSLTSLHYYQTFLGEDTFDRKTPFSS